MEQMRMNPSTSPAAVAGIDTISVCWIAADAARALRASLDATIDSEGLYLVRRGQRGATVVNVDGVTVGTYPAPSEQLFIEGRLAIMLGESAPETLASWGDLDALPLAIATIVRRVELDDDLQDWPLGLDLDDRPLHPIDIDGIEVRRLDLALDLRFDSGDPTGHHLLHLAAHAQVPRRLITTYFEEGRRSVSLSPAGSRAIIARVYDRALRTGEENGRTVRLEAQRRWSGGRRPSLRDVQDGFAPEERWHAAVDQWLPTAAAAVTVSPGAEGVLEAWRAGEITSAVAERLLGTLTAMQHGVELWAADGSRRRRARLAAVGVSAATLPGEARIDFPELRQRIGEAWRATHARRLGKEHA